MLIASVKNEGSWNILEEREEASQSQNAGKIPVKCCPPAGVHMNSQ